MHCSSLAIVAVSFGISLVAFAQPPTKTRHRPNIASGKELFHQHCSVCHGVDAKGKGSMYDPLSPEPSRRVPPADLTVLSEKNGGKFPADRVSDAMLAKGPIPAHGTPNMPAWGDVFYNLKSDPKRGEERVRDVSAYIESIQTTRK